MATKTKTKTIVTETYLSRRFNKPGKSQTIAVANGLSVRISPKGLITFFLRYSEYQKEKTYKLGVYPYLSLLEAQERALAFKMQKSRGDPLTALQGHTRPPTLAEIYEKFMIEDFSIHNTKHNVNHRRAMFTNHVPDTLKKRQAESIRSSEWDSLFRNLADSKPAMTSKLLQSIKNAYQKAEKMEAVSHNAVQLYRDRDFQIEAEASDRFFDDIELKEFFDRVNTPDFCSIKAAYMELLLLTGCRKCELRRSEWTDFDQPRGAHRAWIFYNHKTRKKRKNKPIIRVLSEASKDRIRFIQSNFPNTTYFMGNPRFDTVRYADFDHRYSKQLNMTKPFCLHSLRHTYITHTASLMVKEVRQRSTGHAFGDIDDVYLNGDLLEEMQLGVDAWAEKLISLGMNRYK